MKKKKILKKKEPEPETEKKISRRNALHVQYSHLD